MSLKDLMERLERFEPTEYPFISLYLNAQANERGRDDYGLFVRQELNARAQTFEPHTPARESFDHDTERINRYLEQEGRPSANGIVIFACSGANSFFEAEQLDVPIEQNRLFVYNQPHLYPLARLMEQYPRYAVLLADTNSARIYVFMQGRIIDHKEIENIKTNRSQVGGWSQMRYQRHIDNYHQQHAKEVIDVLDRVVRQDKIEKVILSGNEDTIIPILREQMSKELAERVVDVLNLSVKTPEHEILEATMQALRIHNATDDAEKVRRLLDEYRADGLAVVGVAATLEALTNGQVEELLISATMRGIRYDERQVEKVMAAYAPAAGHAADTSKPRTVADELVKRAEQFSSARITFVEDESSLASAGGVGALLRYRITDRPGGENVG
ncbi:MAG TPA: Vms1/Ankzf1 family peptidyl-tRNA hydrolase [Pyrinomonadaceae bacterium]|nr:Vms1/Ankzf1 family peptidyl-tRNA hydrolase [Pyrinomonadaceae bacterium]